MLGCDLIDEEFDIDKIAATNSGLEQDGVFYCCPTICSTPSEFVEHNLRVFSQAMEQKAAPGVFRVHLDTDWFDSINSLLIRGFENCSLEDNLILYLKCWDLLAFAGWHSKNDICRCKTEHLTIDLPEYLQL